MNAFFLALYIGADFDEEGLCDIIFDSKIDDEPIIFESKICHCEESS